jgi:hypothetical protein
MRKNPQSHKDFPENRVSIGELILSKLERFPPAEIKVIRLQQIGLVAGRPFGSLLHQQPIAAPLPPSILKILKRPARFGLDHGLLIPDLV